MNPTTVYWFPQKWLQKNNFWEASSASRRRCAPHLRWSLRREANLRDRTFYKMWGTLLVVSTLEGLPDFPALEAKNQSLEG